MFSPLRSTCYGLTLTCAISATIIGLLTAFIDDPVVVRTRVFALCLGVFSFFAWIWISILTAYHDHAPNAKDVLSRTSSHTISYALMIPLWLAFGIGLFVQASSSCSSTRDDAASCGLIVTSGGLSMVGALLAGSCIFAVQRAVSHPDHGKGVEFVAYTPLRTALYVWTLTATIFTWILALTLAVLDTFAPKLRALGIALTVVSFILMIWLSILTSYHMRPDSDQRLTRASVHFYTYVSIPSPCLVLGIKTLTQAHYNCNTTEPSDGLATGWCGANVAGGSLSVLVAILAAATVVSIFLSGGCAGLERNICSRSGESEDKQMDNLVPPSDTI